ncbi:MAG: hypothetical protein J6Q59_04155, partial [Paludibacteraceae bacterium]|nr:hypothetical protein [Paludibacteraceae bacterium]
ESVRSEAGGTQLSEPELVFILPKPLEKSTKKHKKHKKSFFLHFSLAILAIRQYNNGAPHEGEHNP